VTGPELEVTPEPPPEERAAIEAAVAHLLSRQPAVNAWWDSGGVEADDESDAR
jgi:hypothetical protein